MKIVQGDLIALALEGHFDVIIHGCNCDCAMGAGIGRSIRQHFPEAYAADAATKAGDLSKLGSYSMAVCARGDSRVTVINAYTQAHPSGSGVLADYDAIRKVMRALKRDFAGSRFGYPKLGAGLARGDWPSIAKIISEELRGEDHTLVEFAPQA
jgi:O-acetyl-ADP-ribose deacetylase (regulator of RNase III)